jgi:hypothetical protein
MLSLQGDDLATVTARTGICVEKGEKMDHSPLIGQDSHDRRT